MNPPPSVVLRTQTSAVHAHAEHPLPAHHDVRHPGARSGGRMMTRLVQRHDDVDPRDRAAAREPEHVAAGGPA